MKIQSTWATVKYRTEENKQEPAFELLIADVDQLASTYPNRAEPKVWQGIIRSSHAGTIGGLSALSNVKKARDFLLAAKAINDRALNGSIYTSLGALYAKVPGWPIAFGDDDIARELLEKAVEIDPDGLEPNFFYGEFLYEEGEYAEALKYLTIALAAPNRKNRELADAERKTVLQKLLAKVKQELSVKGADPLSLGRSNSVDQ